MPVHNNPTRWVCARPSPQSKINQINPRNQPIFPRLRCRNIAACALLAAGTPRGVPLRGALSSARHVLRLLHFALAFGFLAVASFLHSPLAKSASLARLFNRRLLLLLWAILRPLLPYQRSCLLFEFQSSLGYPGRVSVHWWCLRFRQLTKCC